MRLSNSRFRWSWYCCLQGWRGRRHLSKHPVPGVGGDDHADHAPIDAAKGGSHRQALKKGDRVRVCIAFTANDDSEEILNVGEMGIVQEIDADDGAAAIKFDQREEDNWVERRNFRKLKIAEAVASKRDPKTVALKRLEKELVEMRHDPPACVCAGPVGDNMFKWQATIIHSDTAAPTVDADVHGTKVAKVVNACIHENDVTCTQISGEQVFSHHFDCGATVEDLVLSLSEKFECGCCKVFDEAGQEVDCSAALNRFGELTMQLVDSPYKNGVFSLDVTFPSDYPFKPPKVKFTTPLYHCNVGQGTRSGYISLRMLHDQWFPAFGIKKILSVIQSLLERPDPAQWTFCRKEHCRECGPCQSIVDQYLHNREEHDRIAREWTKKYAT